MRRLALERLGHQTIPVDYMPFTREFGDLVRKFQWRLRLGPMIARYNASLVGQMASGPDMVWVDKGLFVRRSVLVAARRSGARYLVHYSPDNYFLAQNSSRHFSRCLPLYDLVVTTKTDNVVRLKALGAKAVFLSGNAFDPEIHRPVSLSASDAAKYRCDVSFIGRWEPQREEWLERVASLDIQLLVRGPGWERARLPLVVKACRPGSVLGQEYAMAISGARINLAFLSKLAGDQITQRSMEIPACGAFMLAERTQEHMAHFEEGSEAAYFTGPDELCDKVIYYLQHDDERQRIAAGGRARCLSSGYTYDERLRRILLELEEQR